MIHYCTLILLCAALGCAAPPASGQPSGDAPPSEARVDSLAARLLTAAQMEIEASLEAYESIPDLTEADRPDAQSLARRRVLVGALAAERAETLLRIRFLALGRCAR